MVQAIILPNELMAGLQIYLILLHIFVFATIATSRRYVFAAITSKLTHKPMSLLIDGDQNTDFVNMKHENKVLRHKKQAWEKASFSVFRFPQGVFAYLCSTNLALTYGIREAQAADILKQLGYDDIDHATAAHDYTSLKKAVERHGEELSRLPPERIEAAKVEIIEEGRQQLIHGPYPNLRTLALGTLYKWYRANMNPTGLEAFYEKEIARIERKHAKGIQLSQIMGFATVGIIVIFAGVIAYNMLKGGGMPSIPTSIL